MTTGQYLKSNKHQDLNLPSSTSRRQRTVPDRCSIMVQSGIGGYVGGVVSMALTKTGFGEITMIIGPTRTKSATFNLILCPACTFV